jgi:YVTN family beta-propeller protein
MTRRYWLLSAALGLVALTTMPSRHAEAQGATEGHSPIALALAPGGARLYVAEATARQVSVLETASGKVIARLPLPAEPTGLALARDGARLFVTCAAPAGSVVVVDTAKLKAIATWPAGHTATAPVLSPDGATLYVCNRFDNTVSILDTRTGKARSKVAVAREPVAAAITPDGSRLFVANLMGTMPSTAPQVYATVSVVDPKAAKAVAEVPLPDGSNQVRGITVSPDGSTVYVVHILGRYQLPTTQLERGWMNTNALTLIDAKAAKPINTVLLDEVDRGAANPWAVACSADGKRLVVTHAGTHEITVIDVEGLRRKLASLPRGQDSKAAVEYGGEGALTPDEVPEDLTFLVDLRERVTLPVVGPRSVLVDGQRAWVAGYFSDSVAAVDLETGRATTHKLGPDQPLSLARQGELYYNDAALCFQQWQSCISCHPDARADGLNWDLMNDGLGNPKNSRSMLLSHRTPPAMSLAVRDSAEVAVRAGIKYIQFAVRPDEDAQAIDAYLKSLRPVPSPRLVGGKLSKAAERGKAIFANPKVGCGSCHSGPLFTNLKAVDVGTSTGLDEGKPVDTPTLIESWRTAPYLHDGRAATMLDLFKTHNAGDKHGHTSQLSQQQLADLVEYVLSL